LSLLKFQPSYNACCVTPVGCLRVDKTLKFLGILRHVDWRLPTFRIKEVPPCLGSFWTDPEDGHNMILLKFGNNLPVGTEQ